MKLSTLSRLLLSVMLLSSTAVACGSSKPVAFSDIPVLPTAKRISQGDSSEADALAKGIEKSAAESYANTELEQYMIPWDTLEVAVYVFYSEKLDTGWEKDNYIEIRDPPFFIHSWKRGRGTNEQALHVGVVYGANDAFLIVALSSK